MLTKLIVICYKDSLKKIFQDNEKIVINIFNNFNNSLKIFNSLNKLIIHLFLFLIIFNNLIFILIFFFKFKLNHISESKNFLCKISYFKNIDNFIRANLLLHIE
jgi:hypothetical protein